jgi:hypothetical protein
LAPNREKNLRNGSSRVFFIDLPSEGTLFVCLMTCEPGWLEVIDYDGPAMKELCKLKKSDLHQRLSEMAQRWDECVYLCKKCGRVAPDKSWLCKPKTMATPRSSTQKIPNQEESTKLDTE